MEDFDMGEFNKFMDEASRFGKDASSEADATMKQFMDNGKLKFLKEGSTVVIDENGHLQVTSPSGEVIDFTKVTEDFGKGDFKQGFSELKFDTSDPAVRDEINKLTDATKATPNFQTAAVQDSVAKAGRTIKEKIGPDPPKTDADLAERADKVDRRAGDQVRQEAAEFNEARPTPEDIDEYKKTGDENGFKRFKDWLCKPRTNILAKAVGGGLCSLLTNFFSLAYLAVLAWLAVDLVDFIKKVEASLSGCWSYIGSDRSCKILPLTCSSNDRDTSVPSWLVIEGKNFAQCQACPDYPGSAACNSTSANNLWIPILNSQMCPCNGQQNFLAGYQGDNFNSSYTSNNNCAGCTGPAPAAGLNPACPNAAGCVAWNEACQNKMNDDCSSWCDSSSSVIKTRPNQSIACKQCDFSCALAATIGDIFHLPPDPLEVLERILLWIAIGIVIIVVGYTIFRFISSRWKNSDQQPVKIEIKSAK